MRTKLVMGNWKMNGSRQSVDQLLNALKDSTDGMGCEIAVCPPAVFLQQSEELLAGSPIKLGAQDSNPNGSGAYTGEVSLPMLAEFGCEYVLAGHSERRAYYGESNEVVAEKFAAIVTSSLTPVLCVGETEQEREEGQTEAVVLAQLDAVISKAGISSFSQAVIAYEPVWAIGTGKTATPDQAQEVHAVIRGHLAKLDASIAEGIQILYGGSVNSGNAEELFAMPDIDGGLVGGASLKVDDFTAICAAGSA